jgi:hypothetical protein|tara:strand:+ start:43 stop:303 length:261 start_codon:yes stop_codon:yes gene_type:complete
MALAVLIIGIIGPLMALGFHIIIFLITGCSGQIIVHIGITGIRECILIMVGEMDIHSTDGTIITHTITLFQIEISMVEKYHTTEVP